MPRRTQKNSCDNLGKNRSGSLYCPDFSLARQKIYLTSVKSPSHQTVKVFLLKTKLEPKVDALCCWTQTFHGISGIVLSSMGQRKNCTLCTTGVLFFGGNLSICFSFWHVIIIKGWRPLDIGGYLGIHYPLPNPLMLFSRVQDKNLKLSHTY